MKSKIEIWGLACVMACALAGNASGQEQKKPLAAHAGRLVRKDLLTSKAAEFQPARRDIFTPHSSASPGFIDAGPRPESNLADTAELNKPSEGSSEVFPLDLSYIGYVQSSRKIIALVMTEGRAVSVAEGEEILPGFKVEKVSLTSIELVGADSRKLSFSLQGEQP